MKKVLYLPMSMAMARMKRFDRFFDPGLNSVQGWMDAWCHGGMELHGHILRNPTTIKIFTGPDRTRILTLLCLMQQIKRPTACRIPAWITKAFPVDPISTGTHLI